MIGHKSFTEGMATFGSFSGCTILQIVLKKPGAYFAAQSNCVGCDQILNCQESALPSHKGLTVQICAPIQISKMDVRQGVRYYSLFGKPAISFVNVIVSKCWAEKELLCFSKILVKQSKIRLNNF